MIMVTNNDPTQIIIPHKHNNSRQEKPRHLKYLNEFRTQQCLYFLEQQCQFHRPYTCFDWHFPNQRRRKPFKRPDGTFNYNPDVYCDKYDETSGSCVDGDDCPYAHRNAGDTERRYHPRYFKTGNCIYETTENGACVKNGLHCAFAHGPDDTRLPVYDIREVQDASSKFTVNLPASLEKERVLSEDPKWNEMFHVLACYKTELCKKPPRMCRQGYSCPFYHNGKDKRRAPDKWRYRSTPCPVVRPGDEWQDSGLCEAGDTCTYCHTRTEQQFHPEIYKSTKCNDVINSGYCPRGPFCAFAHCDSEISIGRDFLTKVQQDQLSVMGGVGLNESGSRVSQLSSGLAVPNLMSPLANLPGPTTTINATAAAPTLTGRGRRMGRCGSPHHNLGLWQPNTQIGSSVLPGLDRSHHFPGQMPFMQQATVSTSTAGVKTATSCPADAQLQSTAAAVAMLSLTHPSNPGATGHMQFYQHRPLTNMFQNVMTNSMAFNAAARDKGRHRSGSSVSSSESGLFAFTPSDLTSPPGTRAVGAPGTTYTGRSGGGLGPPSVMTSGNPTVRPSTYPNGANLKPAARGPPRKLTQPTQQQSVAKLLGSSSFLPDRSAAEMTQSAHAIRGLTVGEPIPGAGPRAASVQHQQLQQATVPLLQNTLWASSNPMDSLASDRFVGSAWPWHMPIDSGHNSETSITDASDTSGLFEFNLHTNQPGPFGGGGVGPMSNVLEAASNNRDSGLVLDFSLPTVSERPNHLSVPDGHIHPFCTASLQSRDHFTGSEDLDNQLSSEGLQDLIGKSESFLQQLHSTPIRARSGTIVSGGGGGGGGAAGGGGNSSQNVCSGFFPDLYQESGGNASPQPPGNNPTAGFHSPLDDILLQSQSYLDNQSALMNVSLGARQSDSSPVFDISMTGSDPMYIPGRDRSGHHTAIPSAYGIPGNLAPGRPVHQPLRSDAQSRSDQPNTSWPITFGFPSTSLNTNTTNVAGSTFSSPVASQITHGFSPVVGTPATNRFTGQASHTQQPQQQQQQHFSIPTSLSGDPEAQHMLDLDSGSANITPIVLNKGSMEADLCGLSRDPSVTKFDTCSESSSSMIQTDISACSADLGTSVRPTGNRGTKRLINGGFSNLPQSPILMSSPFNNPGYELERISLQRELNEVRQRLDSKEDELEAIKRQRDFVAEHLRDSLGVIQKLFHSFHVSNPQEHLSRPLFVDTDNAGTGSDQSTGYSAAGFTASEASPIPEDEDTANRQPQQQQQHHSTDGIYCDGESMALGDRLADKSGPPTTHQHQSPSASSEVLLDRTQLQQQQEALAALFANPFVSALLNSTNTGGLDSIALGALGQNPLPFWRHGSDGHSDQLDPPQPCSGCATNTHHTAPTSETGHAPNAITFQSGANERAADTSSAAASMQESRIATT